RSHRLVIALAWPCTLLVCGAARALGPADVFILVNKNVPASREVADYYCARRGVPKDHIVALDLPAGEDIRRRDYNTKLGAPLRAELKERRDQVKVLLCVYGVPLRVGRQEPSADEKEEYDNLRTPVEVLQGLLRHAADEVACLEHQHGEAPGLVSDAAVRQFREQVEARKQELHV